jgi:hypothetical protein
MAVLALEHTLLIFEKNPKPKLLVSRESGGCLLRGLLNVQKQIGCHEHKLSNRDRRPRPSLVRPSNAEVFEMAIRVMMAIREFEVPDNRVNSEPELTHEI